MVDLSLEPKGFGQHFFGKKTMVRLNKREMFMSKK